MQHFVQRYIRRIVVTEDHHAYRVAHENDVDATLIEQARSRIIVRRQRRDLLTAFFHLLEIFHTPARRKISRPLQNASCGENAMPSTRRIQSTYCEICA